MKTVFDSTEMNHLKLKNRLFRSGTWDKLVNKDGTIPDEVYSIYKNVAKGGIGTIISALTDISPDNWCLKGNMRLCSDELIPWYKCLTDLVKKYDCNIITQLTIDGYANPKTGKFTRRCVSVEALPSRSLINNLNPVTTDINDLTQADIEDVVSLFAKAAVRAKKAGFDGVQIHAAYSWMLNRFIDPQFNHRTDVYGGTPEKRARILVEVLDAIRGSVPDIHITAKVGFTSALDDKSALNDVVVACRALSEHGIDSIELSANKYLNGVVPAQEEAGYLHIALAVKKVIDTPIILVGRHRHIENMERILNETPVEYFSMCRPLICEPGLPNRWKDGDRSPAKCISCNGCFHTYGNRCLHRWNAVTPKWE